MMASDPPMLPPSDNNKIKNSSSAAASSSSASLRPPEQGGLKCPRCDSSNTKFCYYNNYSLSQPRHFCKTCRRYWTKGGALRNVPVGGGCRKSSKKSKSGGGPSSSSSSSSVVAANFQLGMLPAAGVFNGSSQFIGFNYPIAAAPIDDQMFGFGSVAAPANHHSSIASSIESLSSINQDLHWKLQQQRLAMLFGGGESEQQQQQQNKMVAANPLLETHHHQQVEPISFQVAERAKGEICGAKSHHDAWFLESHGRINGGCSSSNNNNNSSTSDWNGITTWSDMTQFSALP